jgi:beta-lactamase regulating signal transducer with metallopeptidase domain
MLISFAVVNTFVSLVLSTKADQSVYNAIAQVVPSLNFLGLICTIIWIWGAIFYGFSTGFLLLKKIGVFLMVTMPLFMQGFFVWACLKSIS